MKKENIIFIVLIILILIVSFLIYKKLKSKKKSLIEHDKVEDPNKPQSFETDNVELSDQLRFINVNDEQSEILESMLHAEKRTPNAQRPEIEILKEPETTNRRKPIEPNFIHLRQSNDDGDITHENQSTHLITRR